MTGVSTYHTAATRPNVLHVDASDVLWWGSDSGLVLFDGTTATPVPNLTNRVSTIVELRDQRDRARPRRPVHGRPDDGRGQRPCNPAERRPRRPHRGRG